MEGSPFVSENVCLTNPTEAATLTSNKNHPNKQVYFSELPKNARKTIAANSLNCIFSTTYPQCTPTSNI